MMRPRHLANKPFCFNNTFAHLVTGITKRHSGGIRIISLMFFIILSSCGKTTTRTLPSNTEWLQTPISEETLRAYGDNVPITNKTEAIIAARAKLLTSRIKPIENPRVISAGFIRYKDAIIRMQAKESDRHLLDKKVWLVNFEGDFTFTMPEGSEESFFGNVFVMLLPSGGILVTWRKIEK